MRVCEFSHYIVYYIGRRFQEEFIIRRARMTEFYIDEGSSNAGLNLPTRTNI
jgi:hypothetical protein